MLQPPPLANLANPTPKANPTLSPEAYLGINKTHQSTLPACYSPSIYSTPSIRNSCITLFEEHTMPTGLGISECRVEEAY
jgi:hypothetical protein